MKLCIDCSSDITGTHHSKVRCTDCQTEAVNRQNREYQKRLRERDPEKYKAYHLAAHLKLRAKDPERVAATHKRYYEKNRETLLEKYRERRLRKKQERQSEKPETNG